MQAAHDVAIVGAGIAGIAAAERLRAAGHTVTVLEARDRIGGRAVTDTATLGAAIDLGAQWVHTGPDNPLAPLLDRFGLRRLDHRPALHYRAGRRTVEVADSRARFETAVRGAGDVAVSQAFPELSEEDRLVAGLECSVICGTDPDRLSALDWATMVEDTHSQLLAVGLGRFVAIYAEIALAGCELYLGCPVTRIERTGSGLRLSTSQGALEAKAVLLTVPVGVLAAEAVRFDPPLPDWKQAAIDGLPMGLLNKLAFRMDAPVDGLPDGDHITLLQEDGTVATCLVRPLGLPYAIVFTGGRFAAALEAEGREAGLAYGRDVLHRLFGSSIDTGPAVATAWAGDPWSRGAYATARPGRHEARAALARPVEGGLFFAGEATETIWAAQLAGAWRSGLRAADEIVASL